METKRISNSEHRQKEPTSRMTRKEKGGRGKAWRTRGEKESWPVCISETKLKICN